MPFLKLLPVLAAAAALAGCMSTEYAAQPVTGDPVNPTPVRGYRVQCQSTRLIPNLFGNDFTTNCQPVVAPASAVIVAKG